MSKVYDRAGEARQLLENDCLKSLLQDIKDEAVSIFSDASRGIDEIAVAHEKIKLVQLLYDTLQTRLDAESVEIFKTQRNQDQK
jgi:vacuolar-type H+-ATPase subunit H